MIFYPGTIGHIDPALEIVKVQMKVITPKTPSSLTIKLTFDFRFVKKQNPTVINNNVVISVQNQFGEAMPFFNIPIGGVPKYQPMITIEEEKEE